MCVPDAAPPSAGVNGADPYLKELGGQNVVTAVKVVRELPCLKVILAFAFYSGK